jgi:hypothetical protein
MKNLILSLTSICSTFVTNATGVDKTNTNSSEEFFFENCFERYLEKYDEMRDGGIDHDSAVDGATIFFQLCMMRNNGETISELSR